VTSDLQISRSGYTVLVEKIPSFVIHYIGFIPAGAQAFRVWVIAFRPGRTTVRSLEVIEKVPGDLTNGWIHLRSFGMHNETRATRHMVRADITAR
jgi:hypothetical protein